MENRFFRKLIDTVKQFFNENGVDVPFIIAGGSPFSYYTNGHYEDIDVYFYNEDDFNNVVKSIYEEQGDFDLSDQIFKTAVIHTTGNAITCVRPNDCKIQLVSIIKGTPQELFDTFDLNCSKIAITSNYEEIKDKTFSTTISVDFRNFKNDTCERYYKYTIYKGANDPDQGTLYSILDFLIENYTSNVIRSYNMSINMSISNLEILKRFISNTHDSYHQYIHDQFVKIFKNTEDVLIDVFIYLYGVLSNVKDVSDEYIASHVYAEEVEERCYGHHSQNLFDNERIEKVREKFAEYFI